MGLISLIKVITGSCGANYFSGHLNDSKGNMS
jgi:hypothetical protein